MAVTAANRITITLEVARYLPGEDERPHYQSYEVPYHAGWVVLDALNYLKDEVDGTLSYRWSCRMGVCGSCGAMVNGVPKLTCATFLRDYLPRPIRIEPLANFPVERDLIISMDDFMEKLPTVKPWILRESEQPLEEGEYLQTPAQLAEFKQFSMCINCMLCFAACPVYQEDEEFLGPAVLALAQRYNHDSRDEGRAERNELIWLNEGVWDCTFVGECSVVCPKGVDPAGAIQQAKLESTLGWYRSLLMPFGRRG
ncbi:MAG TPA: succinate dehydrogenase/fumarate reductase iron-sulfur subunit [Solirubrobacteraceae bacterium]|nr:succinate dehydrogenase/fumarate reductase iron-sulfur subunit [Solirubrobacteraceae bacterium]